MNSLWQGKQICYETRWCWCLRSCQEILNLWSMLCVPLYSILQGYLISQVSRINDQSIVSYWLISGTWCCTCTNWFHKTYSVGDVVYFIFYSSNSIVMHLISLVGYTLRTRYRDPHPISFPLVKLIAIVFKCCSWCSMDGPCWFLHVWQLTLNVLVSRFQNLLEARTYFLINENDSSLG